MILFLLKMQFFCVYSHEKATNMSSFKITYYVKETEKILTSGSKNIRSEIMATLVTVETTYFFNVVHSQKPVTQTLVQRECPSKLPVTQAYHTHDRSRLPGSGRRGDGRRRWSRRRRRRRHERTTGAESGAAQPGRAQGDAGCDTAPGLQTHRLQGCRGGDAGPSAAGHGEGREGRHPGAPARQVGSSVCERFFTVESSMPLNAGIKNVTYLEQYDSGQNE